MSGNMFDKIFSGNVAATLFGNAENSVICQGDATNAANMANNAQWQSFTASQAMNSWSTPLSRPPGIYWRRTGGKTHMVEVVR